MSTPNLPEFPDEIGADEPVVSFSIIECRSCGERSPMVRTDPSDGSDEHARDADHIQRTGHGRYYVWRLSRHTSRTFIF